MHIEQRFGHFYFYKLLKITLTELFDDNVFTLAAALSYYTALSLAPLVVLLFFAAGFLGPDTQFGLLEQLDSLVGRNATEAIHLVIESSRNQQPSARNFAGLIGFLTLIFSATAVFGQLQYSLNRIWNVQVAPYGGFLSWIKKRLLSIGMIFAFGFLLLVSLVASAALQLFLPEGVHIWKYVNLLATFFIYVLFFALTFKFLPDAKIKWRDVWTGALLTAALFDIGRSGIAFYLGRSGVASSYGAAGSLIVLLIWVYYSSLILFAGAELTQVRRHLEGKRTIPEPHAEIRPKTKAADLV
jgi:membrane protein